MHIRKTLAAAAVLALFVGCEQSTTDISPEMSSGIMMEAALVGSGIAFNDGGGQPAIFGRLVHAALARIAHDESPEAARAAGAALKPLVEAVHAAGAAHDTTAVKAAIGALRQAEAGIVVRAFGVDVVNRTIAAATQGVAHLNARIAGAPADADLARLRAFAASMTQLLNDAKASAAAGDNVSALISATKVVEALHIVADHRQIGHPGGLPLDTTRMRPSHP